MRQIEENKKEGIEPSFWLLFFVGVGVELVVYIAEAFVGYVRVNLSCGDVTVAKKFLNGSEVNSLVHQVGGVAVAEGVGRGENWDT